MCIACHSFSQFATGEIFSFSVSFFLRRVPTESTKRKKLLFIESLFCLILFSITDKHPLYIFPYQLSIFSLPMFYYENIYLSLNSFDSWPWTIVRLTLPAHTHTHTSTLHLPEDICHMVWEERSSFLKGLHCQNHSLRHLSIDSWISLSLYVPLLGWLQNPPHHGLQVLWQNQRK